MVGIQERWINKINQMGVKPSVADSYAYTRPFEVPCEQLPGIQARFALVGEGNERGLDAGVYLIVGIHPIGLSRYPVVRDAIAMFATQALIELDGEKPSASRNFGQGVEFKIVGTTDTEATILRLTPLDKKLYENIGQMVESGKEAIRITPFKDGEIPPTSNSK